MSLLGTLGNFGNSAYKTLSTSLTGGQVLNYAAAATGLLALTHAASNHRKVTAGHNAKAAHTALKLENGKLVKIAETFLPTTKADNAKKATLSTLRAELLKPEFNKRGTEALQVLRRNASDAQQAVQSRITEVKGKVEQELNKLQDKTEDKKSALTAIRDANTAAEIRNLLRGVKDEDGNRNDTDSLVGNELIGKDIAQELDDNLKSSNIEVRKNATVTHLLERLTTVANDTELGAAAEGLNSLATSPLVVNADKWLDSHSTLWKKTTGIVSTDSPYRTPVFEAAAAVGLVLFNAVIGRM